MNKEFDIGFYAHIKEAIEINKLRKKQYSDLSEGKTKFLSSILIFSERLTIPIAKYYDIRGRKFNERGIMIVKDDFVAMDLPEYDSPIKRRGNWTEDVDRELKETINEFNQRLSRKNSKQSDLNTVYRLGVDSYNKVKVIEEKYNINSMMCKHIIESICLISKNGIKYAQQSNNETLAISFGLLYWHKIALMNSLPLDKRANIFHQRNIGILVNDMPTILI